MFEYEARILFDLPRLASDAAKEIMTGATNDSERRTKLVGDVGDEIHLGFGKLAGAACMMDEGEPGSED
jgi:hypothetical protein